VCGVEDLALSYDKELYAMSRDPEMHYVMPTCVVQVFITE